MNESPRRAPDLFWPIILIGVGLVFLLSNLNVITGDPWPIIARLWPVLLIVIGLDVLFGRRSILGGLIGAALGLLVVGGVILLLIAKPDLPGLNFGASPEFHTQHIQAPLNDAQSASFTADLGSGTYALHALGDSSNLIEGDLDYYGDLTFDVNRSGGHADIRLDTSFFCFVCSTNRPEKWDVGLNARPAYDLDISVGSGGATLDLSKLQLSGGRIDVGSGGAQLWLPASGKFTLRVDSGSGGVNIRATGKAALRVEYSHGSGGINPGPRLKLVSGSEGRDATYETEGFASAQNAITLIVDGGSGSINVSDSE